MDGSMLAVGTQRVESFASSHCAVQEGLVEPGDRHLVRVTFSTPNQGAGSLQIGNPAAPENEPFYHQSSCHGHWHFDDYAHYRLWTPLGYIAWDQVRRENPDWTASEAFEEHPELLDELVAGHKQGFCIIDVAPAVPSSPGYTPLPDPFPVHGCSNQGIARGWADIYTWTLDGQWIDVTGVDPGVFILEGETNPEHRLQESDYANNRAAIPYTVLPLS